MIVGELSGFVAVSIGWHDDVETAREAIAAAITWVTRPAGVIVLTDMFGGTPANLGLPFLAEQKVEVITGVNLPMLLDFAHHRGDLEPRALATRLAEKAQAAVVVFEGRPAPGRPA